MALTARQTKSRWTRTRIEKRPPEKHAPGYAEWLRKLPCYIEGKQGHVCAGKVVAAHWDEFGDKGMSTKVSDQAQLPLCHEAHREQTDDLAWPAFQAKYGFDAGKVCADYWRAWPGLAKWLRKLADAS